MELKIKPHPKNSFPFGALLIKNNSAFSWIKEIQLLGFLLEQVKLYPIPGTAANTVWGCMVIPINKIIPQQAGKHELCQILAYNLFIPEKAILVPALSTAEIEKLFSSNVHVFHPEFGLAELAEELDIRSLLTKPVEKSYFITKPQAPVFIPTQIKSFQIESVPPDEILKNMEKFIFPKKEQLADKPLNILEKIRLAVYKFLLGSGIGGSGRTLDTKGNGLLNKLDSFLNRFVNTENNWTKKLQQDFEDLEERNKKEVDKLMDLFKKNPAEALKYAIPLDSQGSTRGLGNAPLNLSKRWFDFSLFGGGSNNGQSVSGTIDLGDHFHTLQRQYYETAEALTAQGEFHKAAFVYMKLLKDYSKAAETLEKGKYYQEAAVIYLKHAHNKEKAAVCYEKGRMTNDAIELYKELQQNEKVGDLYLTIFKRKEADIYFEKVIDDYKFRNQFVKASLIYRNKMNNPQGGQIMLLEGWRANKDGFNCLNNYFGNIDDIKDLKTQMDAVYTQDVNDQNRESFLQVIKHEYQKKNELADSIKEMAYEIVATQIPNNPSIVGELKVFNSTDKELVKDTVRFKLNFKTKK